MRLEIGVRAIGDRQVGNGLRQRALGHHVDRTGHTGRRGHAREQNIGAAQHFDAFEHLDRHRVGRRNAIQAIGGDVDGAHVQAAQIEVLQHVVLVGGEDDGRLVLQHILQGQRRPVLGQFARVGIDMHGRFHDGCGAQDAQTCP